MTPVVIAPGVWLVSASMDDLGTGFPRRRDMARARTMVAWRAREFLAGRALLRSLLSEVLPEAADADVVPDGNGRPELAGWPKAGISIAHDDWTVAACVSPDRHVGVDVQHPPEHLNASLVRRCVREGAGVLDAMNPTQRARELAWIWTAQEACVKAEGTGLSGRPWSIDVPPRHSVGSWKGYHWLSLRGLSETPLSCAWKEIPR
ncbi:hypothetical protein GCM10007079_25870 [Nocardiopsis terrae]|uniref:4'-phosphopantetheinyl transferase n=1 Tax=Nocardiopsis terrae TaxID=372655 RepID=A0ABR9HFK3_9ACTN|nr:4'-phosphopantetheinyl transferase superfamily protein [Nocardiopsis terrae]MBE1457809.1 4'-phosphopantetheinyl transferase [Nocardiopsis terrae]GHC84157.1 hypothetical protein GCM10007079_25870 [Nocardiopsis terrae]